jgi:hypothetical protein
MGAGIALHADGFVVDAVELPLGNIAVIAPQFLLGAQLHAVVGELAFAALAVLAGTIFAAVDGVLRAAPHILPHTAVDLVFRLVAVGHRVLVCCVLEDRALLCPVFPEPTSLGRSGGQDPMVQRSSLVRIPILD